MARPPSTASRRALLDAAAMLLDDRGAGQLTVAAVTAQSGVAKTTLYRHFGSLDGLVFTLIGERVAQDPAPDTGSLAGDLRAVVRAYLDRFDDPLGRELFVWMLDHALSSSAGAAAFSRTRFESDGPTATVLRRAIERGEIPSDTDVELVMHVVQGALISKRVIGREPLDDADFDRLLDMTLRSLGASPKPHHSEEA